MNVFDLFSLEGEVAIVTGGYGHLGRAMSDALVEAGAIVYVMGRNEEKFLKCGFNSDKVHFILGDVTKSETIAHCFATIFNKHGHIDILINNATNVDGGGHVPEDITDAMW